MSEVYTAPTNRHEIIVHEDGAMTIKHHVFGDKRNDTLVSGRVKSLREFFRDERDAELGRWRWPENPEWVVYRLEDDEVIVFNEGHPGWDTAHIFEDNTEDWPTFQPAARAYFAAHPEPKPWRQAQDKEVWALRFPDQGGFLPYTARVSDGVVRFFWTGADEFIPGYFASEFKEGRKIWPED